MKNLKILLFLCLLAILSACAPTVKGTSSSNPKDLSKLRVVTLTPDRNWYLTQAFDFRDFDFDNGDFATSVIKDPRVGKRYISNANSKIKLLEADLPENWKLSLWNANVVKRVTDVSSSRVYFQYTVHTNFVLRIPADAELVSYRINATLKADNGSHQNLAFTATLVSELPR